MEPENFDVVVIGAGLSGINTAYRVQTELPHHSLAVLESRHEIGGTWAFWKYPGIRTDSSMGVFGLSWRPWPHDTSMAPGPAIKAYLEDCAAAEGIDKKIRFRHCVVASSWSSEEQRWTLQIYVTDENGTVEKKVIKAWWIINCSGYYSYEKPLPAVIPGIERFGGEVIHPQFWNDSVKHAGKKVVIIGSGATAVTLLPALAEAAESVTMLQRSPSYIFTLPGKDPTVSFLSRFMPRSWAAQIHWWQEIFLETMLVFLLTTFPARGRRFVIKTMRDQLPAGFDVDKHFNPRYNPFEQRLCFCPNGDFFKALHTPKAHIVTDTIATVNPTGIQLTSGQTLDADMIITATGLYFALLSGISVTVDGTSVSSTLGQRYIWNGCMLEGVPNAGLITGYTAATWTPGADVRARQLIAVIKHMDRSSGAAGKGTGRALPYIEPAERARMEPAAGPAVALSSTYMVSALERMPKVGDRAPWVNGSNWVGDAWRLMTGSVKKGIRYTEGVKKDV
jgi:cation diffusion facilitator CzcD-associated flavoprotein CzcO